MGTSRGKRKRARARGYRKQSRREKRKRDAHERFFVTCLLVNGPPPSSAPQWDVDWRMSTYIRTNAFESYKNQVQTWWLSTITSTPPPKQGAGIRFFRRFMYWYRDQIKEQADEVSDSRVPEF